MAKRQHRKEYARVRFDSGHHRRIAAVMAVLGLLAFLLIGARLYDLMINHYDYYARKALQNQTRTTSVTPRRGTIYDQNMNMLAVSVSVENVYLDPHELKQAKADITEISRFLGDLLDLEPEWIQKQAVDFTKRYKQIAANVEETVAKQIRTYINENQLSGIHLEPSTKRYYPCASLAAQVIGFTNASNTGSEGIEAAYNTYLEGKAGSVITTKGNNEMDMPYSYEKYLSAQQGCDVILTIDGTVQACLENRLNEAIARYDVQNGAFGLVMNAKTGEILAMATLGSYDPNAYLEIADTNTAAQLEKLKEAYQAWPEGSDAYESALREYRDAVQAARLKQWRNRCISDGYEPGSTFKVLTLAAALDSGAVDLKNTFSCSGAARIPGRAQLLHCWRTKGHGSQTTAQTLQNSCNLAFANIALRLGGETFYDYIQNFGVLEKSGVDLYGESSGVFFSKEIVTNTDKWGTASLTSASFGQTFKLTPLQLVRAIAAVVNGGYLLEPYIVSEVVDPQGNTVLKQERTVLRQVIKEETSRTMCSLLRSVVSEGTAKNAGVAGFSIGGKTGTSEKIDVLDKNGQPTLDKIVSFVGIAPMDDPEYIVLVALDTPSRATGMYISGGVMAAPTAGAVLADILPYLGVEMTVPDQDDAMKTVILEDMQDMSRKEAEALLKKQSLTAKILGTGEVVTGQIPAAGQSVPGGSQVILYCGEDAKTLTVAVPDFTGMNRQQASDLAGSLGLYILVTGNGEISANVKVVSQNVPPGETVENGTTIQLKFADLSSSN